MIEIIYLLLPASLMAAMAVHCLQKKEEGPWRNAGKLRWRREMIGVVLESRPQTNEKLSLANITEYFRWVCFCASPRLPCILFTALHEGKANHCVKLLSKTTSIICRALYERIQAKDIISLNDPNRLSTRSINSIAFLQCLVYTMWSPLQWRSRIQALPNLRKSYVP